jgi:hypothetical protein
MLNEINYNVYMNYARVFIILPATPHGLSKGLVVDNKYFDVKCV